MLRTELESLTKQSWQLTVRYFRCGLENSDGALELLTWSNVAFTKGIHIVLQQWAQPTGKWFLVTSGRSNSHFLPEVISTMMPEINLYFASPKLVSLPHSNHSHCLQETASKNQVAAAFLLEGGTICYCRWQKAKALLLSNSDSWLQIPGTPLKINWQ